MFVFKADNMPLHQTSQYSRIIIAKNIRMAPQIKKKKPKPLLIYNCFLTTITRGFLQTAVIKERLHLCYS